jgi:tRNA threonylcarbamoyl adenosine modification protein YeaZ
VVLVIDTSSPLSALALVRDGCAVAEDVREGGRERDLPRRARALADPASLAAVVVSLGPGSFTGLRLGVSYGVGLAMGLGIPLRGLGSLELQAARAAGPATALVDAGRGRVYWLEPDGEPRLGAPAELPAGLPGVGWLRPATARAVEAAGVRLLGEGDVLGFAEAAARLAGRAPELDYDTVRLRYMQSFRTALE